jgi:subtilisin family serine protease
MWKMALLLASSAVLSGERVIRSPADLPPERFAIASPASDAFLGDEFAAKTLPALRRAAEKVLAESRVEDPVIAQRLRAGLIAIALLDGRSSDAGRLILEQRAAETKPQLRAIGFLLPEALAAAGPNRDCKAAAVAITKRLAGADAKVVRDEVLRRNARLAVTSLGYYAGIAVGSIDPEAKATGSVDLLTGMILASWRMEALSLPPCRDAMASATQAWLDAPANAADDIWPAREPKAVPAAKPVTVAVWESGYDASLFPGQLAFDPAEPADGRDNDGNGVVDDGNGPTFDYTMAPMTGSLAPPTPFLAKRLGLSMALFKGELDLNYGLDTPEARVFAQRARSASTAEQGEDGDAYTEFDSRSHATWVASIIADGAPYVRLYNVAVLPFGEVPRPMPITEADIAKFAAKLSMVDAKLKSAGVRIVNMSWGMSADGFAERLMRSGTETDQARANARGRIIFEEVRPAMLKLMTDNPDILFVAAAGNSNQSTDVAAWAPQTFVLPNLLIAGAAGASGGPTSFTTFGKEVAVYAPGEGIAVRAPGGMVMRSSGTSFASPKVARTAAAMLAVDPGLSPAAIVTGIKATATAGPDGMRLLHPVAAVDWARDGETRRRAKRP